MKLEKNERPLLFSETSIPDIFFSEHLSEIPGDYLKIYLYLIFLSKYNKDAKLTDLSRKLNIPLKSINDGMKFLEEHELVTKKSNGYIINDLQEITLHNLYSPNLSLSKDKIEQNSKNKSRAKAIEYINNTYFQGIMGPSWYNDIDLWFKKYSFDEQVMIALFDYCYKKSALHRNYVQTVAEAWASNNIKTYTDLDNYYEHQEALNKMDKIIAKKLGKYNGLTQYEKAYIENWVTNYGYDMSVIEIALKRTTYKQNPTFEYINKLITDWHNRNLKTPSEVNAFLEQRKKQEKNKKQLTNQVNKANYEQRQYSNLDYLYANNTTNQEG